ncbi:MAG: hypothetical protein CMJ45_11655 [Planctomyces sp.]|nr:hypothetical protein [Planctomyces sp.]
MTTTKVKTESKPVEGLNDAGDGQIELNPVETPHSGTLARMCANLLNNAVLSAVGTQVMAFHDWISDPPMTERDRNKLYIIETRNASKRRRLAGR